MFKSAAFDVAQAGVVGGFDGEGEFEAVVAVFNNVDHVGDRIMPGAFANSLTKWAASGDRIPIVFDHRWSDLDAIAGEVLEAQELLPGDSRLPAAIKGLGGLYVRGQLDLEDDFGRKLFNRLKRRRVREFSFAYSIVRERKAKDANELLEVDIIEVGPTLKGANPATQLIGVKSFGDQLRAQIKRGRVLSAVNEAILREAISMIEQVLETIDTPEEAPPEKSCTDPEEVLLRLRMAGL